MQHVACARFNETIERITHTYYDTTFVLWFLYAGASISYYFHFTCDIGLLSKVWMVYWVEILYPNSEFSCVCVVAKLNGGNMIAEEITDTSQFLL